MGKVITIWGSPNSGKTTLSIKLAKELAKDKSVIVLFSDILAPVIPILKEDVDTKKSLGNVLSVAKLTNEEILKNCIELNKVKNIGFLGYTENENIFSYPQYTQERVIELIELLRELADYVIIDSSSNFVNDLLTTVALDVSDSVLRLNSSELKNISYYNSYLPLLIDNKFKLDRHINIVSNFRSDDPIDELIELYNAKETIEYNDEIREQGACSELLSSLSLKEENILSSKLKNIISIINIDDIKVKKDNKEEKKKGFFKRFRKGA